MRALTIAVWGGITACGPPATEQADAAPQADAAAVCPQPDAVSLRVKYAPHFSIGAAVEPAQLTSVRAVLQGQLGRLTAENAMKLGPIHPAEATYDFADADAIASFARASCMAMTGHALVWHQQTPTWLFAGLTPGNPASIELLKARLEAHIGTVVARYFDVIDNWDVVNEAISDNGPNPYRNSSWYQAFGSEEYIYWAFKYAKDAMEAIAPGGSQGKLYYNDYNVELKLDKVLAMLSWLKNVKGIQIDGVGLQSHWRIDWPSLAEIATAIDAIVAAGYKVKISELDVTIYNDYPNGTYMPEPEKPFTAQVATAQATRYRALFELLRQRAANITSVTWWGVSDDHTWLDSFPVAGRDDHPLLYDDAHAPKPAYDAVVGF